MSAVLDTVQEFRAEQAAEHLKVSVALKEQVLRDGQEVTVPGQDLVPGDVVLLAAGDLVPADGRLLEARDFFVNEALLTGESYPAEKHARDEGVDSPEVAEATNAAFMGSSVMNGSARLMVCGTGLTTQLGQISSSLRRAPPPSALEQGTHRFGMLIVRLTEILVLFVLLINLAVPPALAGELPVRRGSRCRAHARTLADDRLGDARAGRHPHGEGAGDRETARRDP